MTSLVVFELAVNDVRPGMVASLAEVDRDARGLLGDVNEALAIVVSHLVLEHHHLHLLVQLHVGRVLRLHGLAHLLRARVLLVVGADAAEEDDAGQAAAEDDDRDDDHCNDASSDGICGVDSLAGSDETIAPVASALPLALAELAVTPVLVGLPPPLACC